MERRQPLSALSRRAVARRRAVLTFALAFTLLIGLVGALPHAPAAAARADEVTASYDNLRTGWDPNEPGLSPGTVGGGTFGQIFSTPVDGQVYAQPIVAGSTLVVATENDWIYGLNALTGKVIWSRQVGQPWPAATAGCHDLTPYVGVTGTPVYDPDTGSVYLVAESLPADGSPYHPVFDLFGLDASTGQVTLTAPIGGAPVNDAARPFNAYNQLQRPGLLLVGGRVYAAFGSHCDYQPYAGYVAGVDVSTGQAILWSDEAGLTDDMAGIWQSGGGLMSDAGNRVFFASGNGVSPATGPGGAPPQELAESVVGLGVGSDGTLSAQDFFSPANAPSLDLVDRDLGSGGPIGLPVGTAAHPHLLVQAGKDGRIFVLDRDSLGGRGQAANGGDAALSEAGPFGGQWGHPAVFEESATAIPANSAGLNDYVYYLGRKDYLRALQLQVDSSGRPILTDVADSAAPFGYTSGSPVVTSDGPDPASAVVWVVNAPDATGANATLEAFDAVPQTPCAATASTSCLQMIWSAPIGTATKFAIPATDSGRVYVGTRDGDVLGFGAPSAVPLTGGSPVAFPATATGSASLPQMVTVQAAAAQSVTGITATGVTTTGGTTSGTPDPFSIGQVTVIPAGTPGPGTPVSSYPVALQAGDQLQVPVTFSPASPGPSTGAVSFATDSPTFPSVDVSLSGSGTQDGLYASADTLSYGNDAPVPVGATQSSTINIINYGTQDASVSAAIVTGPFNLVGGAPAVVPAGGSVPVTVTYAPTQPTAAGTPDQGALEVDGSTGSVTVNLTGVAVSAISSLQPPQQVDFGLVRLGHQATTTIDITNTGTLSATVQSATHPYAPFGMPSPAMPGLPLNPGYDLKIPLTFTPTSVGAVGWTYQLTWTDLAGTHTLSVPVTGTGEAPTAQRLAVTPPGGGWTLNGSARVTGLRLKLTPAAKSRAGSAVYPQPVSSGQISARFRVRMGGGTGANGVAFAMLDPATSSPTSIGGAGLLLGFGGLAGDAVILRTSVSGGHIVSHLVIARSQQGSTSLTVLAATSQIPDLRKGQHTVLVTTGSGKVTAAIDGTRYLSHSVALPPQVLAAFTGSTGTRTDRHLVRRVAITASGVSLPPPGGGWSFNARSGMAGSVTRMTSAAPNRVGTVVYPAAVPALGLRMVCDVRIGGGTGAYGLTFALLDPMASNARSVGEGGANLGFGGLTGVAVALDTHGSGSNHSDNFAGLTAGQNPNTGLLAFQVRAVGIQPLRSGTHILAVRVVADTTGTDVLIVSLDGEQIFQRAEPLLNKWGKVRLAFTGSTGALTDVHSVRDIAISVAG